MNGTGASLPVVSVVTVVLNDVEGFRRTARSVTGQQYPALEFIVIDGGSTDGTLEAIRLAGDRIAFSLSESDHGIYDAMNKGIDYATGEWILFLNAGDVFADPMAISQIFTDDRSIADIIVGDSIADYGNFRVMRKAGNTRDLWKGMPFCHQAMLFRTALLRPEGYSPAYALAADFELVYRLHAEKRSFVYLSLAICRFDVRGISNRSYIRSWRERYRISKRYGGDSFKMRLFYTGLLILLLVTMAGYKLLPEDVMRWMIRFRERAKTQRNVKK